MKLKLLFLIFCINILASSIYAENNARVIKVSEDIELIKIEDGFYIHTSWFSFPDFGRVPSNGLIFIDNGNAILVDSK